MYGHTDTVIWRIQIRRIFVCTVLANPILQACSFLDRPLFCTIFCDTAAIALLIAEKYFHEASKHRHERPERSGAHDARPKKC